MNRGTRERGERERVVRWRWLCNVERVWNREKSFNATAEEQVHSAHSGCHFFRLRIQRLTITVIIGIVSIAMVQTMANATRNQTPIYYYILVRFPYRYLNSLANKIRNLGTSRLVTTKLPRWNLVTLEKIAKLVKSTRRSSLSNATLVDKMCTRILVLSLIVALVRTFHRRSFHFDRFRRSFADAWLGLSNERISKERRGKKKTLMKRNAAQ